MEKLGITWILVLPPKLVKAEVGIKNKTWSAVVFLPFLEGLTASLGDIAFSGTLCPCEAYWFLSDHEFSFL